jgi:membrane-associated phospholipid phosphatase
MAWFTTDQLAFATGSANILPESQAELSRGIGQTPLWKANLVFSGQTDTGSKLGAHGCCSGDHGGPILCRSDRSKTFSPHDDIHEFRNIFNGNATAIGMGATAASLYAIGRFRKDSKMQHTALLAGEAMADTALVQMVLKDATMRLRPVSYPASGWFVTSSKPTAYIRGNGSFPSGHSIEAFAVATIIARRYGNHRWVPFAAYGLASAVGFSRLTLNVHFLSDVFMGSAPLHRAPAMTASVV